MCGFQRDRVEMKIHKNKDCNSLILFNSTDKLDVEMRIHENKDYNIQLIESVKLPLMTEKRIIRQGFTVNP